MRLSQIFHRHRKSAKDFYFEFYEGGEISTTQEHYIYEGPLYEKYFKSATEELLSFRPNLSNDYKTEVMISDMLSLVTSSIRRRLERCFVVTQFSDEFVAFVRKHRTELDGEIIFFASGLSNAVFAYSVLLGWFVLHALEFERVRHGLEPAFNLQTSAPQLTEHIVVDKLRTYAKVLGDLQARWSESGQVTLDESYLESHVEMFWEAPEPVRNLATSYAVFAHKFIIGHEYAHYLLGHLDGKDDFFEYCKIIVDHWLKASSISVLHEFEADLLSVALNSGAFMKEERLSSLRVTGEAASGMAFTLTVLGQMADPQQGSATHPTITDRLSQCATLVNSFMPSDERSSVLGLFRSFQRFLFETQGRGAGSMLRPRT